MRRITAIGLVLLFWLLACLGAATWRVMRFSTFPPGDNYEQRWDFQVLFFFVAEFWWVSIPCVLLLVLVVLFYEFYEPAQLK